MVGGTSAIKETFLEITSEDDGNYCLKTARQTTLWTSVSDFTVWWTTGGGWGLHTHCPPCWECDRFLIHRFYVRLPHHREGLTQPRHLHPLLHYHHQHRQHHHKHQQWHINYPIPITMLQPLLCLLVWAPHCVFLLICLPRSQSTCWHMVMIISETSWGRVKTKFCMSN